MKWICQGGGKESRAEHWISRRSTRKRGVSIGRGEGRPGHKISIHLGWRQRIARRAGSKVPGTGGLTIFGVFCKSRLSLRGATTVNGEEIVRGASDYENQDSSRVVRDGRGRGGLLRRSYLAEALFWLAYYVGRRQLSAAGKPHET